MPNTKYFLVIFCISFNSVYGQNFHAFLFCNTSDKKIGVAVRENYVNIREQLQLIANALNLKYTEHSLTGPFFTSSNVQTLISTVDIKSDDFVVIYVSTHGSKTLYDSDLFPYLYIPQNELSSYRLYLNVLNKKPRFLLAVIEACSGYSPVTPQEAFLLQQADTGQVFESLTNFEVENVKRLFLDTVHIIITAGNPGKNTWATPFGSMFTNCFLKAMSEFMEMPLEDRSYISWNNLLNQAKQYTWDMTAITQLQYYPVWEMGRGNVYTYNGELVDSSALDEFGLILKLDFHRTWRIKNKYTVNLSVSPPTDTTIKIMHVIYYLDRTMENPILDMSNKQENFFLSMAVWGEFPVKAKVFLSNGKTVELYRNFNLKN